MTFTKSLTSSISALAVLALLAGPAAAQEATEDAQTAEETVAPAQEAATPAPAEEAATPGDDAATADEDVEPDAAPEPQEPQPGQQYLRDVYSDWAIRCLKLEEGQEDPCQMYQLLNDADGNSVAEIAIVPLADQGQAIAGATFVVPLETLLTEQLTLRVDGGDPRRFPFNFCNPGGCVTRLGLSNEDANLFRRGANATLTMVPAAAPDQTVTVTMSLSGFTAAFDALTQ